MKSTGASKLSLISARALRANLARTTATVGGMVAIGALGLIVGVGVANAQVTPGGSVTNIVGSPSGATQNVTVPSGVGEAAAGTLSISGAGTTLNLFDGVNPDAFLRVGNAGTGRVVVNDFGTLNLTASNPASDDAFLFISATPFNSGPSQAGTLILGDDPNTGAVENTGFLSITATDDAVLSVGRNGAGDLLMTNSSASITSLGASPGAAAIIELGASTVGNAVGSFTATNSSIVVDAQGGGPALVSVGRRTNTVTNPNAATAPENTLLLQAGSNLQVTANTNDAFFNVGRDGARGTATVDGVTTRLEVGDHVRIGRDGGFGTLNVQNGGTVDNFTVGRANETRLGDGAGSTGTLNINTGGTYETTTLSISHAGGGDGTVNVDGAGSNLNLQGFDDIGRDSRIVVGGTSGGTGELNVTGGGNVTINTPGVPIATIGGLDVGAIEAGSTGVVNVSGAGSHVNVITGTTHLGFFGDGTINVTDSGTFTDAERIVIGAEGGNGVLNVNTGGSANARILLIGDDVNSNSQGTANIDGAGSALNLTGIRASDGRGAIVLIGNDIGTTGEVNLTNGAALTVDAQGVPTPAFPGGVRIGGGTFGTGGVGTLNVDSGSTANIVTGIVDVGVRGTGNLNVLGGGSLNTNGTFRAGVEAGSTGTVTVDGTGSKVDTGDFAHIGFSGDGNLNVTNGGVFESTRLFSSHLVGSTSMIEVNGAGSRIDLFGADGNGNGPIALIGREGASTMNVTNGATVNMDPNGAAVTGLPGGLLIGGATGSTGAADGTVNVDGSGSAINIANQNASIQVGRNATGKLNLTDGGKVTNAPGDALAIVGRTALSTGTVLVSGAGSEFQAGSDLFIGTDVDLTTRTILAGGGSGTVTVEDGGALSSRRIFLENGSFDVTSGGTVGGRLAILGSEAGVTSEMTVTGAGSRLDLTGKSPSGNRAGLVVGDEGMGTLNINDGGKVEVNAASEPGRASVINLGGSLSTTQATGNGIINVDGAGSELRLSSGEFVLFQVGRNGQGELNVTNGGAVVVEDPDKEGQFRVGRFSTATGAVNVGGPGSSVIAARETIIGQQGTGSLSVTNGGSFQTSRLFTSLNPGGVGNVDIDGAGSQLNLRGTDEFGNGPIALVGREGLSTMNVTNGATVNMDPNGEAVTGLAGGLLIGGATGTSGNANGTVNVSGAGSAINIGNQNASIQVGRNGTGALNITGGGKVTNAPGNALSIVGRTALSTGTVNVTGTGSEWQAGSDLFIGTDVDFGTRTAIGNGGQGTVNVANGGTLVAGEIFNGARGTITGGGGTIIGNITNSAGGTIAAGNSPGLMSVLGDTALLGGGTMEIELGGTVFDTGVPTIEYDRLDVADNLLTTATEGTVAIDAGAIFDIDFFGVFTAGLGDTFDVIVADEIDVTDLSSLIFDFADAGLMSGLLWEVDIVDFGRGREALQLSVVAQTEVSEPAAMLILIGGVGVLAGLRRRRRGA